jgi:DNA-binding GntR family transcriptional regulator
MKSNTVPQPRSDEAFSSLRSRILEGVLEPGTLLAEAAVARELGISRVPVREALFGLERDGLVEFSESGRAYVKELSPQDFEELFILRQTLEPAAARLAQPKLKADFSVLERNIHATRKATSLAEVTRLDLDFHERIVEASGNLRLLKLWRSLRSELELWLRQLHRSHRENRLDTREGTAGAHEEIVRSFQTATPAVCERLMLEHIQGWREWLPLQDQNPNQ